MTFKIFITFFLFILGFIHSSTLNSKFKSKTKTKDKSNLKNK